MFYLKWLLTGMISALLLLLLIFALVGCGDPAAVFAGGFGTGVVTAINEANASMESVKEKVEVLNEKAKELDEKAKEIEVIIKNDPVLLANVIDPNLGEALEDFIANVEDLTEKAEDFKEESKGVDWERLLMAIGLGVFGGGAGVNLYKNRKTSP